MGALSEFELILFFCLIGEGRGALVFAFVSAGDGVTFIQLDKTVMWR